MMVLIDCVEKLTYTSIQKSLSMFLFWLICCALELICQWALAICYTSTYDEKPKIPNNIHYKI